MTLEQQRAKHEAAAAQLRKEQAADKKLQQDLVTIAALKALEFAKAAHGEQKRKYTGEPYHVHLTEVASMVAAVGAHADVVAAAYLHDVLEDTQVTAEQLTKEFGPRVTNLVLQVTDVSRPGDGNRAARKAIDAAHLSKATYDGATIKLADLVSNTRSIVKHDRGFARTYLAEKHRVLLLMRWGHPALRLLAWQTWEQGMKELEQ